MFDGQETEINASAVSQRFRYGSVCSGIEAATVAWHPLGWEPAFFAEIEPFPSAVLSHHYPHVPNFGDMTKFVNWPDATINLLVGGTPCQSFSVAGLRRGMADPRGNLTLTYLAVADRYRPRWLVWENVPGVLSSNRGRDFGAFLGGLGELGYGFAYRVLDAQYVRVDGFGRAVPQRRRRVFVVGHLGDWRPAAAVLFERESLLGNSAPRREEGEVASALTGNGVGSCGPDDNQARARHPVPVAFSIKDHGADASLNAAPTLRAMGSAGSHPNAGGQLGVLVADSVRRLTPRECERLQGFPDGYTDVPYRKRNWTPDGPRYKALGNSMAVNVMRWIGHRIGHVQALSSRL